MPRTKKIIEEKEEDVLLSESEVDYVLRFAESLSGYGSGGFYGNALNPMLLNQRMKDITMNPMAATESMLEKALLNPKDSELILQSFSQDFENQNQIYKKLLSYLGTMLAFDLTYESNAKASEYSSAKYQRDLDIVKKYLTSQFDYRKEFATIVQEMLRNEAYFGCPRFDNDKITIQEMPSTYCTITGRWPYGLLYSMNLYYLIQPGVDINMLPSFFKTKFNELWGNGKGLGDYQPSLPPELRGQSSWVYVQDIPVDVGTCFKFNPNISTRLPYYSGLFLDLIQQPLMRALQKNINMSAAARLIVGEIPLLGKTTQASVKDQFAIGAKNLGEFLSIVKTAVGESLKVASLPLTNVQGISFNSDNQLYSSYLRTSLSTSGVNTNLLFTGDVKPNSLESQLSLNVDEQQMYNLYPQFEQYLDYSINKLVKNYRFKFHFEGSNFFNNRQQRFDKQMSLSSLGVFLPQKLAASMGMNVFEMNAQLEEAKAFGYTDKLTIFAPAFQGGGVQNEGGRPKKSESDLTDSGEQTRSDASNIGRGGKSA